MWRSQLFVVALFVLVSLLAIAQRGGNLSSGTAWGGAAWAPAEGSTEAIQSAAVGAESAEVSRQRQLFEFLDSWVQRQRHHRAVFGHYAETFVQLKLEIPEALRDVVDFRVLESSSERFLGSALLLTSSVGQHRRLRVTVDQDFRVRSTFKIPEPRSDYLKELALRHLRLLSQSGGNSVLEERSVFRGWFRYVRAASRKISSPGVASGSEDRVLTEKLFTATGVRAPVRGLKLELSGAAEATLRKEGAGLSMQESSRLGGFGFPGQGVGPQGLGSVPSWMGELAFAHQIFSSKFGRQPRSLEELAGSVRLELPSGFHGGGPEAFPAGNSGRGVAGRSGEDELPLEVEPVESDEDAVKTDSSGS
jgi:hypothetical protein